MQVWPPGWKIPWRRKWQSTSVFLPGESHRPRSLAGYSPWGLKESDTTEWLNDNKQLSKQYSCRNVGHLEKQGCCCQATSVLSNSVQPRRRQPTRLPRPWDSPGKNTGVGCHFLLQCMKVKRESEIAQSCLTLSNPMDCSLPGSSIHWILQARVLEWGAIAFSKKAVNNNFHLWAMTHSFLIFLFSY